MRKYFYILLFISSGLFGQAWSADSFNVIFEHDFEANTYGGYVYSQWLDDWWPGEIGLSNGLQFTAITNKDGTKALMWTFPYKTFLLYLHLDYYYIIDGKQVWYSVGPTQGEKWYAYFVEAGTQYEDVYVSYDIMFKPGFNWVRSGKIPSMQGPDFRNSWPGPEYDEGFRPGLRWDNVGGLKYYLYVHNWRTWDTYTSQYDPQLYEDFITIGNIVCMNPDNPSQAFQFNTSSEQWYHVTERVCMNTVNNETTEVGNKDGLMEVFINGKLSQSADTIIFRNVSDIGGNSQIRMHSTFGGNTGIYACTRDEWILIDNVKVWTYAASTAPGVREAHTWGEVLHLPDSWSNTTMSTGSDTIPNVNGILNQSITAGGTFSQITLDDYVSDGDHADNELTWTYSGNTYLSVDITSRVATITAPGGWTGSETITFTATDPNDNADSDDALFTVNAAGESNPDKILVNFHRYAAETPPDILGNEFWNHLDGQDENDLGATASLYDSNGDNTDFTLEITSNTWSSHSTTGYEGTSYPDSCEIAHWRVAAIDDSATFDLDGFIVDSSYSLKVYCSNGIGDYGNTGVTFLDTSKTINTYQNDSIFEWNWTADATTEELKVKSIGSYAWMNLIEIDLRTPTPGIFTQDTIDLTDTISMEIIDSYGGNVDITPYDTAIFPGGDTVYIAEFNTADDWIQFKNVDFVNGFNKVTYVAAANTDVSLSLYIGPLTTREYAVKKITTGGDYNDNSIMINRNLTDLHSIYIKSTGACKLKYLIFENVPAYINSSGNRAKRQGNYAKIKR